MSDDDWQAYFCSLLDAHLLFGKMTQQHTLPVPGMAAFAIIIIAGAGLGVEYLYRGHVCLVITY